MPFLPFQCLHVLTKTIHIGKLNYLMHSQNLEIKKAAVGLLYILTKNANPSFVESVRHTL